MTQMFHLVWRLFGWVWRTQTISGARGGHAQFPDKNSLKNQKQKINMLAWISYNPAMNNSLLSSHKKSAKLAQKNIYAQIWACAPNLTHNFAK